jgi:hypothetical protein
LDDAEFEPPTVFGPTDEPPLVTLVAPAAPLLLEPAAPADQPSLVEPPSGVPARPEVLAAAGPDLASRPVPGPTPPAAILAEAPVLPEAPLPLAEPEGDLAAPPAPELAQAGSPSLPTASVPDSADLEAAQVPAVEPPSAEGADAPAVLAVAQSDPAEPPSPGPEPLPVQAPAALPQVLPATPGPAEEAIALDEATPSEPEPPALPAPAAVRILRLGAAPAAPEEPSQDPTGEATEDTADAPAAEAAPLPEDAPALLRHAAPFAPPAEARPLLSVILVDEGLAPPLPQVLAALPVPVSVAIDPALPDAAERLAAYRAQGIEALVVASLPELAKPQDAAVFLGAAVEELPDTVALLDLGQGGLSARNATAQMGLSIAARTGQGVVMAPQGFNSGLAAAQSQGVPAVQILRDLDSAGQDNPSIRRSLDDAVRRAGQGAQPVLLGRIRPDTLQAIADWTAEGRAEEVTVAPISALLVAQLPPAEDPPVEEETAAAP